jgi:hypothetical protein
MKIASMHHRHAETAPVSDDVIIEVLHHVIRRIQEVAPATAGVQINVRRGNMPPVPNWEHLMDRQIWKRS